MKGPQLSGVGFCLVAKIDAVDWETSVPDRGVLALLLDGQLAAVIFSGVHVGRGPIRGTIFNFGRDETGHLGSFVNASHL